MRFMENVNEMEITDDGVGFEPGVVGTGGGFGIPGMQERAKKIGGTLEFRSAPGKGTSVIVRVPANPDPRPNLQGSGSLNEETG
jgi:two-component system, NarL family, sensor histidine kinase UhpB